VHEIVCGRERIEPKNGEVPYGDGITYAPDGTRSADFILGTPEQLAEQEMANGIT
jgi:hypothetical protein